jgi:hypothetical protein
MNRCWVLLWVLSSPGSERISDFTPCLDQYNDDLPYQMLTAEFQ